ncbi:hypothetical protein Tco_0681288, partial [Tanacetum coccineum]
METCGRRKVVGEPTPPDRDPRDVETIKRLQQRIQELELQQLWPDSPAEEAKTEPNVWDDESIDVNPFGGEKPRYVNRLFQPRRNDHAVDRNDRYRDDPIRSPGLKIEIPEFTGKVETWEKMKRLMKAKFLSANHRQEAFLDYHNLSQQNDDAGALDRNINIEHLIRRFVRQGNESDPHDVKIASLKQRIQELEFPQLQQDSPTKEVETESNETESKPIIWDIGDEEEEYPFVNTYPSFQEEPIMLVEEESSPVYDTDNEEEESMPVYDTDIEDVIEEEEGFVGKGGFGREEENIEDVVVVANDLCSSMIQNILSVDFEEDINTKSHELMSFEKSIIIK